MTSSPRCNVPDIFAAEHKEAPTGQEGRPTGAPGISLVPTPMEESEVQAQLGAAPRLDQS